MTSVIRGSDDFDSGLLQTWTQVTRSVGVVYTNDTGKLIQVLATVSGASSGGAATAGLRINGVQVATCILNESNGTAWNNGRQTLSFLVPPGDTWEIFNSSLTVVISQCFELR